MNFTSALFAFFFIFVFIVRWLILHFVSSVRYKVLLSLLFLLGASYFFYGFWNPLYLSLIIFTTFLDFLIGLLIHRFSVYAKYWLWFSIFTNLSILAFFKYFNFFAFNLNQFLEVFGVSAKISSSNFILPPGISFYTFQSMSYVIDVFRRVIPYEANFLRYSLYISFFPQLVAGPIVLSKDFLPQLVVDFQRKISDVDFHRGLYFCLIGFTKKSVIADRILIVSDFVFSHPASLSFEFLVIGVLSYTIQIYCDFSGYTDIARGCAYLLGFELPVNFNMPYISTSLTEFWRRWHISLSKWLRDYLYIPMGGNRMGDFRTYQNLLLTMLLGGLWHGASWNFVIWGGFHGLILALERLFSGFNFVKSIHDFTISAYFSQKLLGYFVKICYGVLTFVMVSMLWVFFRSQNLSIAHSILKGIFSFQSGTEISYTFKTTFGMVVFFIVLAHLFGVWFRERFEFFLNKQIGLSLAFLYSILIVIAVLLSDDAKPFIYFVF